MVIAVWIGGSVGGRWWVVVVVWVGGGSGGGYGSSRQCKFPY